LIRSLLVSFILLLAAAVGMPAVLPAAVKLSHTLAVLAVAREQQLNAQKRFHI
jgi:hypothetical protein